MAKQDLRAQMEAARAAAAFIGAAQEELNEALEETEAPKAAETPATPAAPVGAHESADGAVEAVSEPRKPRRTVRSAASDVTRAADEVEKPKQARARRSRSKAKSEPEVAEPASGRMTAQVLVPMTAEQREHADLLASVMKITRAEVMRQALDEYWDHHKAELQAVVMAYEQLIKKLMK